MQEELITKHNYVVKVTTDPDDSLCVMVEFAGRKQVYYRVIVDEEGNTYGIAYWSNLMDDEEGNGFEEFLFLNQAVIRTYIICDIFRQCRWLDLPYDIIRFYSPDGDSVEFTDLLSIAMDDNERENEQLLEGCMSGIINGVFDINNMNEVLEEKGLLQSMNILRSTLL